MPDEGEYHFRLAASTLTLPSPSQGEGIQIKTQNFFVHFVVSVTPLGQALG